MTTRNGDSDSPGSMTPLRWPRGLIPLLLIVATLAAYWPILHNDFVNIDDGTTVFENQLIRRLTLTGVCSFWTSPQNGLYAPLTYSLFAAISLVARKRTWDFSDPHASPFNAWPFHAVSLLLHVLAVLIVYRLLRRLIGRPFPAAAGALLFALHPVQVETVAWVTEINGLLCGMLSLLAVLLYLRSIAGRADRGASEGMLPYRRQRWNWFGLATEVFVLAILAKPLGVVVPMLALVVFWMVWRQLAGSNKRIPWELTLWFAIAALLAVVAQRSQPVPQWWVYVAPRLRPLVAADALAFYGYKLLLPITLIPDYSRSPHQIQTIGWAYCTWIVPATLACAIVLIWWKKKADSVLAGAVWFIVALLPVLGLVTFAFQHWSTVADRYLYLPMFGVALCAAGLLKRALCGDGTGGSPIGRIRRYSAIVLTAVILISLGVRTRLQTYYWRDTQVLFDHTKHEIGREPAGRVDGSVVAE